MKYVIKDNYDFASKVIQLDFDKKFKKELSSILYQSYYNNLVEKLPPFLTKGIKFKSYIE